MAKRKYKQLDGMLGTPEEDFGCHIIPKVANYPLADDYDYYNDYRRVPT